MKDAKRGRKREMRQQTEHCGLRTVLSVLYAFLCVRRRNRKLWWGPTWHTSVHYVYVCGVIKYEELL